MTERTESEIIMGILSAVAEPVSPALAADFAGVSTEAAEDFIKSHPEMLMEIRGFIATDEAKKEEESKWRDARTPEIVDKALSNIRQGAQNDWKWVRKQINNGVSSSRSTTSEGLVSAILIASRKPITIEETAQIAGVTPALVKSVIGTHPETVREESRFIAKPEIIIAQGDLTWAREMIADRVVSWLPSDDELGLVYNNPEATPRNDFPGGGKRGGKGL